LGGGGDEGEYRAADAGEDDVADRGLAGDDRGIDLIVEGGPEIAVVRPLKTERIALIAIGVRGSRSGPAGRLLMHS
jgi:hypothetical protein